MKKKKYLLFFIILFISIGFAYLSTNLNITGSSLIKGNTWDVHFEDVQVTSGSVSATTPTISTDKKSVNYTVTLDMPGDYFEFTVDAVNDGTIDAMVDTISNTGLTDDQLKYLDYKVSLNNDDPLNHGLILLKNSRKTYKVKLEYKLDITEDDLPNSDQSFDLTFTVNYLQTDENAYTTATFDIGKNIVYKMEELSNSSNGTANVKSFLKGTEIPNNLSNNNIVSISESDEPIYLWFEEDEEASDGTGIIYWYSDADVVFLNGNSNSMFNYNDYEEEVGIDFIYLTDISGLYSINTSKVTNMNNMFGSCTSLSDISALSNWDVSNVRSMDHMFSSCENLINVGPLSNWNVGSTKNMSNMFQYCTSLSNINSLSNWNVSSVTSMDYMFTNCRELSDISGLCNWDLSNVTDIQNMFYNCGKISDISALSNWNVSSVTDMGWMFYSCESLNNISALSNWDVSHVECIFLMFEDCSNLSDISGLRNWDVSNVTNMSDLFHGCESLSDISALRNWDVSSVTYMSCTFQYCTNITDITPLSSWNTKNVQYMQRMFDGCTNLSDATPLENWDVRSVTNMRKMFTDTATTSSTRPSWYV